MKVGIIGTGLLGTSLGLALAGCDLWVADIDPDRRDLAATLLGASIEPSPCDVVVVAVPPSSISEVVIEQIRSDVGTTVTDMGSIKTKPLLEVISYGVDFASKFVPGHPIAGGEQSGPQSAGGDLFKGRPWVLTPHAQLGQDHLERVRTLIERVGGVAVEMTPEDHDQTFAALSHGPQLIASLAAIAVARRGEHLDLAGQGLRDLTRIAASNPDLWSQILSANAEAIAPFWEEFQGLVGDVAEALKSKDEKSIYRIIEEGRRGRSLFQH